MTPLTHPNTPPWDYQGGDTKREREVYYTVMKFNNKMKKQKFAGAKNKRIKIQTTTKDINYEKFDTILFPFEYSWPHEISSFFLSIVFQVQGFLSWWLFANMVLMSFLICLFLQILPQFFIFPMFSNLFGENSIYSWIFTLHTFHCKGL